MKVIEGPATWLDGPAIALMCFGGGGSLAGVGQQPHLMKEVFPRDP